MATLENDQLVTLYKLYKKYRSLLLALAKSCRKVSEKKGSKQNITLEQSKADDL